MSTRFTTATRAALLASSALLLPQAALAQNTPTTPAADEAADVEAPAADEPEGDEIVVTGFRASLGAAINVKRDSI